MHRFLRSIGFSHINTRQDMDKLLGIIMNEPDQTKKIALSKNHIYTEFTKEFASHAGIVVRGEYDEKGFFHIEHHFPYLKGTLLSTNSDITVNKRLDTDAFTGMCDDIRPYPARRLYLPDRTG